MVQHSTSEARLAFDEPFGDWRPIVNRTMTFHLRGLELLAETSAGARGLLTAFAGAGNERRYRALGDPVVRDVINAGLEWRKKDSQTAIPDELEGLLTQAASAFSLESDPSPLEVACTKRLRVGSGPIRPLVWCDERASDALGNRFQELFEREIAHSISSRAAILRKLDRKLEKNLELGCCLLEQLLPKLTQSALAHVHVVGIVDVADRRQWDQETRADLCQNVSTHAIPGTIFLSPSPLRTPWHAAEALLHEAIHKKLSDLVLTRSIFRPGFSAAESPAIRAAWNSPLVWNSNDWSIDRALFAFHVYVHLGLFFLVSSERSEALSFAYGAPKGMNFLASARAALDRAHYLGDQLRHSSGVELGADGHRLVAWLTEVLEQLDPTPPRRGVALEMQLWLDRFDRETRDISKLIRGISPKIGEDGSMAVDAAYSEWPIRRIVHHLVHSEIVAAYRVLSVLGEASSPSFAFYDGDRWSVVARSTASFEELADGFRGIRTIISQTLRNVDSAAYELTCTTRRTKTLREGVQEMVEHAYRHIDHLVTRIRRSRVKDASN